MNVYHLLILALTGFTVVASRSTSPIFHRTFSDGCVSANIASEADCSLIPGRPQWSSAKRAAESDKRYQWTTGNVDGVPEKCYSKVSVYTQICNSERSCVMTSYKFSLPRRGRTIFDTADCANDWSLQTKCKVNGPGGQNTMAVHYNCFAKGVRSYCGVRYETCNPIKACYAWTKFKPECYSPCKTPNFDGVVVRSARNCRECDGGMTNSSYCSGGAESATKLGRCIRSPRVRRYPDCVFDSTTTKPATVTTVQTQSSPKATTPVQTAHTWPKPRATTTTVTTKVAKPTEASTTTGAATKATTPATTKLPAITKAHTTQAINEGIQSTSVVVTDETTSLVHEDRNITPVKAKNESSVPGSQSENIAPVDGDDINSPSVAEDENTTPSAAKESATDQLFFYAESGENTGEFNLTVLASGAGAGAVFLVLVVLLIVLLVKRNDTKRSPSPSFSSSSFQRTPKNPVVDSSSFRIATWIRERPSLPNLSHVSSSSDDSYTEYWNIGRSPSRKEAKEKSGATDSEVPKAPDVSSLSPNTKRAFDHIYDEVPSDVVKNIYASIGAIRRPGFGNFRRISANSGKSDVFDDNKLQPPNENAIYAVVRKTHKRKQRSNTRDSDTDSKDLNFRIVSDRSSGSNVTTLNGRHLREGVIKIEFDEVEGLRCKLADSDVYIDLENTELPPVV